MAATLVRSNGLWRLHRKKDSFERSVVWLEAVHIMERMGSVGNVERLLVTFFVSYSECYSQPQLHLAPEHPLDAERLSTYVAGACFHPRESCGCYEAPLVTLGFCEELEMTLWGLHPCDTAQLALMASENGVRGNCLELFLLSVAPFVSMTEDLLPTHATGMANHSGCPCDSG